MTAARVVKRRGTGGGGGGGVEMKPFVPPMPLAGSVKLQRSTSAAFWWMRMVPP